jgi:hypothetical protein
MTKHHKVTIALALFLSVLLPSTANAQAAPNFVRPRLPNETPAPKVVFIGDEITADWASAFAADPNWINKGQSSEPIEGLQTAASVLARFQSDVVSLHPAIVHILIGQGDANGYLSDEGQTGQIPGFLTSLQAIIQEAKAANIQVVLGTEPSAISLYLPLTPFNSVIASLGAANNIPVINYADALCGCIASTAMPGQASVPSIGVDTFQQYGGLPGGSPYLAPTGLAVPWGGSIVYPTSVTTVGYNLMTQMAETAIANMTHTLQGGWLQNIAVCNGDREGTCSPTAPGCCAGATNINTVYPDSLVQFIPIGYYSDGSQHPQLNTNFQGSSGIWTSSNPLVMYVNQRGYSWSNSPGTAVIRYTPPTGVSFSEWIMYVSAPIG